MISGTTGLNAGCSARKTAAPPADAPGQTKARGRQSNRCPRPGFRSVHYLVKLDEEASSGPACAHVPRPADHDPPGCLVHRWEDHYLLVWDHRHPRVLAAHCELDLLVRWICPGIGKERWADKAPRCPRGRSRQWERAPGPGRAVFNTWPAVEMQPRLGSRTRTEKAREPNQTRPTACSIGATVHERQHQQ